MTSKEKLIEFLKSANIKYTEGNYKHEFYITTKEIEYYFDINGNYVYSYLDN